MMTQKKFKLYRDISRIDLPNWLMSHMFSLLGVKMENCGTQMSNFTLKLKAKPTIQFNGLSRSYFACIIYRREFVLVKVGTNKRVARVERLCGILLCDCSLLDLKVEIWIWLICTLNLNYYIGLFFGKVGKLVSHLFTLCLISLSDNDN